MIERLNRDKGFEPNWNDCFMNNGKMMKTHLIEENTIACFAHP